MRTKYVRHEMVLCQSRVQTTNPKEKSFCLCTDIAKEMTTVDGHNPAPVGRVNILFIAVVFSQPFRGYPKNRRQKITYRISRTNRCSPQDPSALKCISFCIGSCNLSRGFSFSLEGIDGNQHGISENAQAVIMKISPVSLHR